MAVTREEVSIKLGVDSRSAVTALETFQMKISKFSNDVTKKLGGIFKATVFGAATTIISQILPTWDEIWSKVYGVDPETGAYLEETGNRLRKLRSVLSEARKNLEQTVKDIAFKNADDQQKAFTLSLDDRDLAKQQSKIVSGIEGWKAHIARLKDEMADVPLRQEEINKAVEKQKSLEADLLNVQSARLKIQDKISGIFKGIANKTADEKEQRMSDAEKQSRSDLEEISRMGPSPADKSTPKTNIEKYLEIGRQSAAERYAAARGETPKDQPPMKVIVVGVDTK